MLFIITQNPQIALKLFFLENYRRQHYRIYRIINPYAVIKERTFI